MPEILLREEKNIRVMGRDDGRGGDVSLFWSGSGIELNAKATALEIEIDCAYHTHKPYLSFEVDGLRAQTFAPLNGRHFYSVFLGLSGEKAHCVRVIKETQPFAADPQAHVRLIRLRTDGEILPPPARRRRVEFIGDSITSGEGGRGPETFMEWVPMVFCASENYTRLTADRLRAEYQVLSQSGYGFLTSFDNNPAQNMPALYDEVCAVSAQGTMPYDFSFRPDAVVIALGANDGAALAHPPFVDENGVSHKLSASPADGARLEAAAYRFICHVHEKNPQARLVWMLFYHETTIESAVRRAVARAAEAGIDVSFFFPAGLDRPMRQGRGSRSHPGIGAHKRIAAELARILR